MSDNSNQQFEYFSAWYTETELDQNIIALGEQGYRILAVTHLGERHDQDAFHIVAERIKPAATSSDRELANEIVQRARELTATSSDECECLEVTTCGKCMDCGEEVNYEEIEAPFELATEEGLRSLIAAGTFTDEQLEPWKLWRQGISQEDASRYKTALQEIYDNRNILGWRIAAHIAEKALEESPTGDENVPNN